ncbi:MAG: hypothetical protein NT062_25595 [Proteobacteria bacterium]|nr:hypothetical protein [Pseudomonadota bacterium]
MCCFSRAVRAVSSTQIFARQLAHDRQALVYAMTVELDEPVAMVLPVPVVPGGGDDALAFVDLSGYPTFFADLDAAFPDPPRARLGGMQAARGGARQVLAVHAVGAFVASYVPSPADFDRLDPRFRMPSGVFAAHPAYADWGFAVFQLAPKAAPAAPPRRWFRKPAPVDADPAQTVHPMAFVFPSRRPRALYFPTLHVHDGAHVPATARYDHTLFCQSDDDVLTRTFAWRASARTLGTSVDTRRAGELVAGDGRVYRTQLFGDQPNVDHWFESPTCDPASLEIRHARFACDLAATAAYATTTTDNRAVTARTRLDALSAHLRRGLAALVDARGDAWHLGVLPANGDAVPTIHLSSWTPHVFTTTGVVRIEPGTPGPFLIQVPGEAEAVEPQNVRFVFDRAPSREQILEIRDAISQLLADFAPST